jgi:hypothetical protein
MWRYYSDHHLPDSSYRKTSPSSSIIPLSNRVMFPMRRVTTTVSLPPPPPPIPALRRYLLASNSLGLFV